MKDERLKIAVNLVFAAISLWFVIQSAMAIIPWLVQTIGLTRVTIIILMLIGLSAALGLIFLINESREDQ